MTRGKKGKKPLKKETPKTPVKNLYCKKNKLDVCIFLPRDEKYYWKQVKKKIGTIQ